VFSRPILPRPVFAATGFCHAPLLAGSSRSGRAGKKKDLGSKLPEHRALQQPESFGFSTTGASQTNAGGTAPAGDDESSDKTRLC
jgi:hypothetical protein